MKIHSPYGSKKRLFEMMIKVNKLNEEKLSQNQRSEIVNRFVEFVDNELGLNGQSPKIKLEYDSNLAQDMKSYGRYSPDTDEILVVASNRGMADILRTIAHELVHHKQKKENKIKSDSGETGSNEENEANATAGILMRNFGKNNPIIFE